MIDEPGAPPLDDERPGAVSALPGREAESRPRAGSEATGTRLYGPRGLELRLDSREVVIGRETAELTPQEFEVLRILLERADTVVTADELSRHAWGHPLSGDRSFMDSLMSRLRQDLRRLGLPNIIHTVRGVGYRIPMPRQPSATEPLLPGLIESIRTAVILISPEHRIVFANRAAEAFTGYPRAELVALPTVSLLSPGEDVASWEAAIDDVLTGAARDWTDTWIRHKGGGRIPSSATFSPAHDDPGAIFAVLFELHRRSIDR